MEKFPNCETVTIGLTPSGVNSPRPNGGELLTTIGYHSQWRYKIDHHWACPNSAISSPKVVICTPNGRLLYAVPNGTFYTPTVASPIVSHHIPECTILHPTVATHKSQWRSNRPNRATKPTQWWIYVTFFVHQDFPMEELSTQR